MIPVRDRIPTHRTPYVTYGLILANVLVFLWELSLGTQALGQTFKELSVIPCDVARNFFSGETVLDSLRSMFFHGSWAHLLGNMLFLYIFGDNVEDHLGRKWYLAIYLVTGFVAAMAQTLVYPNACVPLVGASGAISGVLGAFLILYPGARIQVAVFVLRLPTFNELPAYLMLGFWFVMQLFYGVLSLGVETLGGGVAFFAHIGGFVAGLLLTFIYSLWVPPPKLHYRD